MTKQKAAGVGVGGGRRVAGIVTADLFVKG